MILSLSLINIHVPNKQTGNSFFKETIKPINPKKKKRTGASIWEKRIFFGLSRCIEPNASGNCVFLEIRESSLIEI